MKILVLEDDQNRIDQFVNRFKEAGIEREEVWWAIDAQTAINSLEIRTYDVLFLDHDLGGDQMVSTSHLNTGSEFARQLMELHRSGKVEKLPMCFIHSFNPIGAENMQRIIGRTSERVPSIWTPPFKPVYKRMRSEFSKGD